MEFLDKTKENAKENLRETNKQLISQSLGFIASAFVFVAGLAWNDAIKELITRFFKADSGLISRFVYALIVTAIAVMVTIHLNKINDKAKT